MTISGAERLFHEHFMRLALREAALSAEAGEIPCGCLVIRMPTPYFQPDIAKPPRPEDPLQGSILARAHNQTEQLADPTAHAEMIALTAAAATLRSPRLSGCIVYVTKEPCPMCAGALIWARPELIVWGLSDPERGGESAFGILSDKRVNHRAELLPGILEEQCREQFRTFFKNRRKGHDQ